MGPARVPVRVPMSEDGGTMNNKVVVDTFHTFMDNDFSVCRVNFRGVGKSDGEFG